MPAPSPPFSRPPETLLKRYSVVCSAVAALLLAACSDDSEDSDPAPTRSYTDPGTAEWVPVPRDQVAETCRLDPDILDEIDAKLNLPWGIVRYGRLCHEFYPQGEAQITTPQENFSATKTLGAAVVGVAAHQTRHLTRSGPKTGPLSDMDRVDHWLDSFTFNPDAHVAHVLGMVAYNPSLAWGQKAFQYDTVGDREINRLSDIVNTAILQDPARFGSNIEEFTQRFLFEPVGMRHSTWSGGAPDKNFAFTWSSPLRDMMRLGLLLLNDGFWNGDQILGADWVYRMTHPSFEDASRTYGYLTWLGERGAVGGSCFPAAIHAEYPHGLSEATDCNGPTTSVPCDQEHDVGVWQANGLNGQFIIGMKGLDMVIVIKDFSQYDGVGIAAHPVLLWPVVRPAVVALDPTYPGDDAAFCEAYEASRYAPDLR
jgi:hypothetical protein